MAHLKKKCWPFCLFLTFHTTQIKYKLIRALMVCLGLEPGAAGWKVQTNPLSYGGNPYLYTYLGAVLF